MSLMNIAEPEWISVSCKEQLVNHVICVQPVHHDQDMAGNQTDLERIETCSVRDLVFRGGCFAFRWGSPAYFSDIGRLQSRLIGTYRASRIVRIFAALQANPPPLFAVGNGSQLLILKIERQEIHCQTFLKASGHNEGFYVIHSSKAKVNLGENVFLCSHGGYIVAFSRCDGTVDCANDASDEINCFETHDTSPFLGGSLSGSSKGRSSCGLLHHETIRGKCVKYGLASFHARPSASTTENIQICFHNKPSQSQLANDLIVDCSVEEENNLIQLIAYDVLLICQNPNELPCKQGHSKCFNITDICSYSLNHFGHLEPCRNAGHMEDCFTFECNHQFKCTKSYWFPWGYVCDGKWDCPSGEDESFHPVCGNKTTCVNMLKCKHQSNMCVHVQTICNGEFDCPLKDDEELCVLRRTNCPTGCTCLAFAKHCHSGSFEKRVYPFLFVFIQSVSFNIKLISVCYNSVRFLHLHNNSIFDVCVPLPENLTLFSVRMNNFAGMYKNCFVSHPSTKFVSLENNNIEKIDEFAFVNLTSLVYLSLAGNLLTGLRRDFISGVPIKYLSFANQTFKDLDKAALDHQTLVVVETSDFQICCAAPVESRCTALKLWYRSCDGSLPKTSMKITVAVLSSLVLVVNVCCLVIHVLIRKSQKLFCWTVISVNASDFVCSAYLAILWISDQVLQGDVSARDERWRSGIVCFVLFGMSLWYSVLSQSVLIFLSLSRLMVILEPIDSMFKRPSFVGKCIAGLSIFPPMVPVSFTLSIKLTSHKIPVTLCSPFVDPTSQEIVVRILVWLIFSTQLLSLTLIVVMHICLVHKNNQSQQALQQMSSKKTGSEVAIVIQLFIISGSNLVCWMPLNITFVAITFLTHYPLEMTTWATVCFLPINAIVNPIVFAAVAIRKKIKEKKRKKALAKHTADVN